ncbi:MAG: DUF4493 domain-containing protein [Bacteroidales bacterium]|nr:DUF4493 domain-containing protein [Bacteroidales bacterium]
MKNELSGSLTPNESKEKGSLKLELSSAQEWGETKAESVDINEFPVEIRSVSTNEIVFSYETYSAMKEESPIQLSPGEYIVKAYKGTYLEASREPYYEGTTNFSIATGKRTEVKTVCKLKYFKVDFNLTSDFLSTFKDDYSITVTNGAGVIIFNKDEQTPAYFKVGADAKSFNITVKVTNKETNLNIQKSYVINKSEDIDNGFIASGDFFNITLDKVLGGGTPGVDTETGITIGVTVDLTMNETGEVIEIPVDNINGGNSGGGDEGGGDQPGSAPVITMVQNTYNLKLSDTTSPTVQVSISAPNGIKNLIVEIGSDNAGFMGTLAGFGLADPFDIANPGNLLPILSNSLESGGGIGLIDANDPILGKTSYLFDVTSFMSLLKLYGVSQNTFKITVSDGTNPQVKDTLYVNVIN